VATTGREARQVSAAKNQALYREVNERVRSLQSGWMSESDEIGFVCECADDGCAMPLTLTLDEYEDVRADPESFAVAPGHVYPEAEVVVSENDRFTVVRKIGAAGQVAQLADRRSWRRGDDR
jgi:hypothetical protein